MWRRVNRWWVWTLGYGLAIPLFALFYWLIPQPFYHATARFEREVRRMPYALEDSLSAEAVRAFRFWHWADTTNCGGWTIRGDQLRVFSLHHLPSESAPLYENSPGDPFARFVLMVTANDTTRMVTATWSADLALDISGPALPDSSYTDARARILSVGGPSLYVRNSSSPILTARADSISRSVAENDPFAIRIVHAALSVTPFGGPAVRLTNETMNALKDYADAMSGFPARVEGSYPRMLFVSAMTITTLGYGDVVPITGSARFLTAVEAVWGVLMVGLFLNSVAGQRREKAGGGSVLTREQVDKIHDMLDEGSRELGEVLTSLTLGKVPEAKEHVFQATRALGECKEALRILGPGALTVAQTPPAAGAPPDDRQRRWIEHATDLRAKGLENMVTVAAVALTLSVTFRQALGASAASVPWLLKASWVAFAVCIVSVIADRLVSSRRLTYHAVMGSMPSKREKWMLASPYILSLITFALGIVTLASFGLFNL